MIRWSRSRTSGSLEYFDIVFGMGRHWPEANLIYLNRGKGVFFGGRSWTVGPEATAKTKVVKLGDMDGDRDLDIAVANACEQNAVFFNALRTP